MSVHRVDVAIVGAGAAGSAAACVLARTASVVLIDRVAVPGWRIGETLPGAARRLLVALGACERFAAAAHGDVPVRISRQGSDEPTEFDGLCDPDGGGWRIDGFNALATGLEAGMATRDALAGDEGAARKYAARVGQVWSAYRRHHALYYDVERRWRDRPFWRRRITPDR